MNALLNQSSQKKQLKALTIKTPIFRDESISSWLIRAALNQGCDPLTFTQFYWPEYRLWTYDPDKGFFHIDEQIHKDIVILADDNRQVFNTNHLLSFAQSIKPDVDYKKINIPWTQPLTKRNRRALLGYQYCPLCMEDSNEARLKLIWRFTWSIFCVQHKIQLQSYCVDCGQPYQPQMLEASARYINHCHRCKSKLSQASENQFQLLTSNHAFQFQETTDRVYETKFGYALKQKLSIEDWFELMSFYVNIVRRAATSPDYMFGKLLNSFEINFDLLTPPKTGLRLNQLPINERRDLLGFAFLLNQVPLSSWLKHCETLNITKNSFNWSKESYIPSAFNTVYRSLPSVTKRRNQKYSKTKKPRSPELVMKLWERVKRKAEINEYYDQDRLDKDI